MKSAGKSIRRGLGQSSVVSPRPLARWRFGPHDSGRESAAPPTPSRLSIPMYEDRHSIGTDPVGSTPESTHPTHLCVQPSDESHKGDDSGARYPSAAAFTFWLYF